MSSQIRDALQRLEFYGGSSPHPHTRVYAAAMVNSVKLWRSGESDDGLKMQIRRRNVEEPAPVFLVRIEPKKWSDAVFVPRELRDPIVGFLHLVSHSKDDAQQVFARTHAYEIFWALRLGLLTDLSSLFRAVVAWHERRDNTLFDEEMCKCIYESPREQLEVQPFEDVITKATIIKKMQLPQLFDGDGGLL